HFGTYGPALTPLLRGLLPPLLHSQPQRVGLLLGRHAGRFTNELRRDHPSLAERLLAVEDLPAEDVATHLAACDLLLQPFPDGVSSRRTSLMSGLALGLPIVTTEGILTEPLWRSSGAVQIAPLQTEALTAAAEELLGSATLRSQL